MKHYDTVIIGSGQAAPSLAVGLAERGKQVALIEGHLLGGSCVNAGCTPTKTLRKSARVAHIARRAADFGVSVGEVSVDFGAAMARVNERVETARRGLTLWLRRTKDVDILQGWGSFVGRDKDRFLLKAGESMITADQVYINTGTRAFVPPIDGIEDVSVLDNVSLLSLTALPDHLIIIGGSYIGIEMGQIFSRLGSKVTLVHVHDRLAEREDEDVSNAIADCLSEDGVSLSLGKGITRIDQKEQTVVVELEDGSKISGSHILFATGRTPNSDRLNLDAVGVDATPRGHILTDAHLQTNVPGIWALGDINRRGAFTHTSYHDHEIVLANMDGGDLPLHQWKDADQRMTTYAMFTDPPLGRVGMSLAEARSAVADGRKVLTAEMSMSDISRAKEEGETAGLIRVFVDAETEQFLGATVFGISGDEIIAVFSNYMATGASYRYMQQALPVHPTVAELLPTILANLQPLEAA